MPAPTPLPYARTTALTDANAQAEVDKLGSVLNSVIPALGDIRRGDGGPNNQIVTWDTLAPDVRRRFGLLTSIAPSAYFNSGRPNAQPVLIYDKLATTVDLIEYIKPTDGGDDALAIQRAHDDGGDLFGIVLRLPDRPVNLMSGVAVTKPLVLQGAGHADSNSNAYGTSLRIASTAFRPFAVSGTAARGFTVRDVSVVQAQPAPAPGWAPIAYPWVFDVANVGGQVTFERVMGLGVTNLISVVNAGRLTIKDLRGQVFACGIYIDVALDACFIDGVEFWPYWSEGDGVTDPNHYVTSYAQQNADALYCKRVDGLWLSNYFAFGCRSALRCGGSTNPGVPTGSSVTGAQISGFTADACKYGYWIDSTANSVYLQSSGFYAAGETLTGSVLPDSSNIKIDGSGVIAAVNNRFYYCGGPAVDLTNPDVASLVMLGTNNTLVQCALTGTYSDGSVIPYIRAVQCANPHIVGVTSRPQHDTTPDRLCNYETSNFILDTGGSKWNYQYLNHIGNGDVVTLYNNRPFLIWGNGNGGTVNNAGLRFQVATLDGMEAELLLLNDVTTLSWAGSGTEAIIGAPNFGKAHTTYRFKYMDATRTGTGVGAWYFLGAGVPQVITQSS